MRATYQLNQEKLDYNYRVLVERDSENTNTIKQQKKKLTRMADILSTLKARYAREEKRFKTENQGTPSRTGAHATSLRRSVAPLRFAASDRVTLVRITRAAPGRPDGGV